MCACLSVCTSCFWVHTRICTEVRKELWMLALAFHLVSGSLAHLCEEILGILLSLSPILNRSPGITGLCEGLALLGFWESELRSLCLCDQGLSPLSCLLTFSHPQSEMSVAFWLGYLAIILFFLCHHKPVFISVMGFLTLNHSELCSKPFRSCSVTLSTIW